MKPKSALCSFLALAGSSLIAISAASAETYTYIVPDAQDAIPVTGNWSTDTKWNAAPVSGSTTSLVFTLQATGNSQAQTTGSVNDIADPFQLNTLTFNSQPSAANGSSIVALNLSGSALSFVSNGPTTPVINLDGNRSSGQPVQFNVANNVTLGTGTVFTGDGTAAFNFSGQLSGNSGFTKTGSSTLLLSGPNNYSGTATVNGGILTAATTSSITGWNSPGNISVGSAGTLGVRISGTGAWTSTDINTLITNTSWASTTSALGIDIVSGSTNYAGNFSGAHSVRKYGAGTLNLNGDLTGLGGSVILTEGTLARTAGGNLVTSSIEVQSGTLSATLGGSGTLTKNTAGTVTLSGNNSSFSGDVFLNAGVISGIGNGTYTGFGTGTVTINGGQLRFNSGAVATMENDYNWNGNFTIDRAASAMPTVTWTGDITLGADVTIGGSAAGASYTHNFGPILDDETGGRSLSFTTVGSGGRQFITLNGNNTFTGNISITQGSLTIGGSGKLGGGDYSGNITISAVASAPITYSSDSDQILRGVIGGVSGLGLTKDTSSTSTLTLTNVNTYNGATTVSQGTLAINGSGSINSSSGVGITGGKLSYNSSVGLTRNVALNGGTFEYNASTDYSTGTLTFTNGTIAGTNWGGNLGDLTIGADQMISPGNSPGTATTTGQTWATGGTYQWEINSTTTAGGTAGDDLGWDLVSGTGTLDINAALDNEFTIEVLSLTTGNAAGALAGFNEALSYTWLIADFDAITDFAVNAFEIDTTQFALHNSFSGTFGISLGGGSMPGDNTQLYLTYAAVPEPRAALLGGLGLLALLRRRR